MGTQALTSLRERIEAFLGADPRREVTEEGELLFTLRTTRYRLEEARGKLLLHLWSAERNWARRVLEVAEETSDRLALRVERFGQARPATLVIATPRSRASVNRERAAARRTYSAFFRRLLAREFPRARLEGLAATADARRNFSSLYTRARLRAGERWWAVLGCNAGEAAAAVDGALTYGLLWLDWSRRRYPDRVWAGLRLFLPAGRLATTAARLAYLARERVRVELFAVEEREFTVARVDERDRGNVETRLLPSGRAQEILAAESSAVERVHALAPEEIELVVPAARNELSLRVRGLEFARAAGGQVRFGVGRRETPLTRGNLSTLKALVRRLARERRADTPNRRSAFYRLQPERWLESLVRARPQAIDPRLAPERVHAQVAAVAGAEHGVADLLAATREGQLVVIELKAAADIHLPLQALDYWLRVRWHQQQGALASAGYFPGVRLQPGPPELLLVAPALQFHPATDTLLSYLSPDVPVTLVGLAEDWRRELKVVSRRRGRHGQ